MPTRACRGGWSTRSQGRCCRGTPSPLYQFLLEGLLLFVLLWLYARKPRGLGQVSGAFLIGYGIFRFIAEYFRQPDDFLGLLALGLSMGQWLCIPMVAAGAWLWWRGRSV